MVQLCHGLLKYSILVVHDSTLYYGLLTLPVVKPYYLFYNHNKVIITHYLIENKRNNCQHNICFVSRNASFAVEITINVYVLEEADNSKLRETVGILDFILSDAYILFLIISI